MLINDNCHLIDGAKNSAIYDLKNCCIYSINHDARIIIQKVLDSQKIERGEIEFIKKLEQMGLLQRNMDRTNGTNNKTYLEPHLKFAWLELTECCNLNCVHCYGQFGKTPEGADKMRIEDWKKTVDYLLNIGCSSIQLIGGEPLAYQKFTEILEYIYFKGFKNISVFTNATLITKKHIELFKKYDVLVRVSLYSSEKNIHDKITQVENSYNNTINSIKQMKDNGVKVSVAVIAMKENEKKIGKIKEFLNSLGLNFSKYDVIRPESTGTIKKHGITNIDILKNVYQTKPEFYISEKQFYQSLIWNPCWYGKVAITARGDVIPCVFSRNCIIGNIKNNSIKELKEGTVKKWLLTKDYIKVCKDCEYRYACHDCRPLAAGINNDLYSKKPRCCYDPYSGQWKQVSEVTKELRD